MDLDCKYALLNRIRPEIGTWTEAGSDRRVPVPSLFEYPVSETAFTYTVQCHLSVSTAAWDLKVLNIPFILLLSRRCIGNFMRMLRCIGNYSAT